MTYGYMEQLRDLFAPFKEYGVAVRLLEETDSTNSEAKRYCLSGGSIPALFVADGQTAGRGRMGRSFFSPADTGIYLSFLIEAPEDSSDILRVTSTAAVVLHKAIADELGIDAKIKWVNDLYYKGRKISGILAESFFVEDKRYIVIGVGINLSTQDFPQELREKAGAIIEERDEKKNSYVRAGLTFRVAVGLNDIVSLLSDGRVMDYYREHSAVLGQRVTFTENGVERCGVAESVDDLGALSVRLDDGSTYSLASGEISLKIE